MTEDTAVATRPDTTPAPAWIQKRVATPEMLNQEAPVISQMARQLKALQSNGKPEHLELFGGPGQCILIPDEVLAIPDYGERIEITPVFRYKSWQKMRDQDDHSDFFLIAETIDPQSPLARKCITGSYKEPYTIGQKKFEYTYKACVNFWVAVLSGPLKGQVVLAPFSGGGYKTGAKWWTQMDGHMVAIGTQYGMKGPAEYYALRYELGVEQVTQKQDASKRWMQLTPYCYPKGDTKWLTDGDSIPAFEEHYKQRLQGEIDARATGVLLPLTDSSAGPDDPTATAGGVRRD